MIIDTTVYTKCHPDTGKPSASKFMCRNTEKYETQRKRMISIGELKVIPVAFWLLPATTNTPLDIQDF